jgi:hydroxymethylglutaryl-CoA lyase
MAEEGGLDVVAYISMAFGNPYAEPWYEVKLIEAVTGIASSGIKSISLADTIGTATPELIRKIMTAVLRLGLPCEVGIHMHSTRAIAAAKIQAAYDAGCRRFDSAIGGLGGCPFAQDDLVGNIPTEEVINALAQRRIPVPSADTLAPILEKNAAITREFGSR